MAIHDITIRIGIVNRATAEVNNLNDALNNLGNTANSTNTSFSGFSSQSQRTSDSMRGLNATLSFINPSLGQFSNLVSVAGPQMAALAVGVKAGIAALSALGGQIVEAVTAAAEFERGILRVGKVTKGWTDDDIPKFTQGLIDISRQSFTSAKALLEIAATAGQLGIPKMELLDFVRVVDKFSVATNTSAE